MRIPRKSGPKSRIRISAEGIARIRNGSARLKKERFVPNLNWTAKRKKARGEELFVVVGGVCATDTLFPSFIYS